MIYAQLYYTFLKIGFTSFGSLSMIPLINQEMLNHQWMTLMEVSDIIAIAEMTPGPLGTNCATFAGMRVAGILGALAANLGVMTPTFTICSIVGAFLEHFRDSKALSHAMMGVRPVCIGIIWTVILNLCQTNYLPDGGIAWGSLGISIIAAYLLLRKKVKIPIVIFVSAAAGLGLGWLQLL